MGKRARSTVVPAIPPAIREVKKGVCRSLSGAMVLCCLPLEEIHTIVGEWEMFGLCLVHGG